MARKEVPFCLLSFKLPNGGVFFFSPTFEGSDDEECHLFSTLEIVNTIFTFFFWILHRRKRI